ncbi:MAG: hypothetical protein ABWX59_13030 [Microbacteriaceae bacterium]
MTSLPPLGLLLDVDGPIASPITRSIAIRSIRDDLVTLANAGVPVVFNTGRSDAFIRDEVVAPMIEGGLGRTARVLGVCEKGAVVFPITVDGMGELFVDPTVSLPAAYSAAIDALVTEKYSDWMFFDHTKRAMVSVEQRTDVASADYLEQQQAFNEDAFALFAEHGIGGEWGERRVTDAEGQTPFRIDPTIISTDIESVKLGKDLGADRALAELRTTGELPHLWRTVGDSRTDYAMADYLHAAGFDVTHVDVRPKDGVPETPYAVRTFGEAIHDDAGALFLRHWAEQLG